MPFSTQSRFARKIANIHQSLAVHSDSYAQNLAWHWRRWARNVERDGIELEFRRNCFNVEALEALVSEGSVTTAAAFLRCADPPKETLVAPDLDSPTRRLVNSMIRSLKLPADVASAAVRRLLSPK